MARRDRVPRHKSHSQQKNKNPKLSPFQREQKRTKLANQAPSAGSDDLNAIPRSQRLVYQYLIEKKARDEARRQRQLEAQQQQEQEQQQAEADHEEEEQDEDDQPAVKAVTKASKSKKPRQAQAAAADVELEDDSEEEASPLSTSTATSNKAKKSKNPFAAVASLNAELIDEVAPARRVAVPSADSADGEAHALTLEERIAKKKERKHQRKAELRRQRVTEKLQTMEAELSSLVRGKNKKGREDENVAFERKLRQMQAERARAEKAAKDQVTTGATTATKRKRARESVEGDASAHADDGDASASSSRKRISFDATVEEQVPRAEDGTELPHHAMRYPNDTGKSRRTGDGFAKPTDFYEMVDVVRFGERVEAPPVFDVVPNRHAAITKLANKLDAEEAGTQRHRLLSGGGGLGEQKRLARMGLAPAITGMVVAADNSAETRRPMARSATASRAGMGAAERDAAKAKEMSQLRAHVMAAYQNNKRKDVESRKGVDMRHQFPRFS